MLGSYVNEQPPEFKGGLLNISSYRREDSRARRLQEHDEVQPSGQRDAALGGGGWGVEAERAVGSLAANV